MPCLWDQQSHYGWQMHPEGKVEEERAVHSNAVISSKCNAGNGSNIPTTLRPLLDRGDGKTVMSLYSTCDFYQASGIYVPRLVLHNANPPMHSRR